MSEIDEQRRADAAEHARSLAQRNGRAASNVDATQYVDDQLHLPDERRIVEFVQRGTGRTAEFDIRLADGSLIEIGSPSTLLHPQRFEAAFATAGIVWDEGFTRKDQKRIAARLLEVRVVVGGDEREQTTEWCAEWFASAGIANGDGIPRIDLNDKSELYDALAGDFAFFRGSDDCVYLRRPPFVRFLSKSLGERVSSIALGMRLERLGFRKAGNNAAGKLAARRGNDVIARSFYVSPPGWSAER